MRNRWKVISIVAVVAGIICLSVGMFLGGRPGLYIDSTGIHPVGTGQVKELCYQEKTQVDSFDTMDIDVEYAEVEIIESDEFYVEYGLGTIKNKPVVEVKDNKLTVKETQGMFLFTLIADFSASEDPYLKIYVPEGHEFEIVDIKLSDGNMMGSGLQVKDLNIEMEYGDLQLDNLTGENISVDINDGNLALNKGTIKNLDVTNEYGHNKMVDMKVEVLDMKVSDGDIKVSGDIEQIDIIEKYGDVEIKLAKEIADYNYKISAEYGKIVIPEYDFGDEDEQKCYIDNKSDNTIKIKSNDGNVNIISK